MNARNILYSVLPPTFWLALFAASASAQQSGAADHALFGGFPDSVISEFESAADVNYRVVLGSLQSTRGQVAPEASERVRGNLTRILYEVDGGFTGEDVYEFFVEQMRSLGYRELFTCSGRACGSSEYWANDIFGNRILYGPVRNQFYLAMGSEPPGRFYISVYVVTRINRQLLAYLEIIELEGHDAKSVVGGPAEMLEQLRAAGAVIVPGLAFDAGDLLTADAGLDGVAELLRLDPELRMHIVAHLQGEGEIELLLARSEARAQAVRESLVERGVDAERLAARGLGPLAPLCAARDCAERVELVLQSAGQ